MSKDFKPKGKLAKVFSVIAIIAVIIGACAGIAAIAKKDTETIGAGAFSRGELDENGEFVKSDRAIYTEEAFECVGLRVEPDFEFKGTFDVYYYDFDGVFIESMLGLNKIYDEDFPLAMLARVVIHPEIPEDVKEKDFKINFWEVGKYARQISVTVNKEQDYLYGDSVNLYNEANVINDKNFKEDTDPSPANCDSKNLVDISSAKSPAKLTEAISADGTYDYYDIYVYLEAGEARWPMAALFGSDGKIILTKDGYVYDIVNSAAVEKPKWVKLTINVPELESYDGVHLMVSMPQVSKCYIFGYSD